MKSSLLTLVVIVFTSQLCYSQVTIGTLNPPQQGALLDLSGGDNNTKGLGMPRVKLTSNSSLEPCLSSAEASDPNENKMHVGLMVYNLNEIDGTSNASMKKVNMLCKGLHAWTGEKWTPIIPYFNPDVTRSAPKEKLTIVRGPSGVETTTYTTAYFHGYSRVAANGNPTTGSVYVCDRSKLIEIDAGQWMTMNLRTKYMPGEEAILERAGNDDQILPRYTEPNYPADASNLTLYPIPMTDKEKELNGYLYNWAAATNRKDTQKKIELAETDHPKIQGICPSGWHLPAIKEWANLLYLLRAQSYLFASAETVSAANLISPFSGGKSLPPEQGGIDFRILGTVHRTADSGGLSTMNDPYMKSAFYWSSTSGPLDYDGGHNGDWTKWNARGLNARLTRTSTLIPSTGSYRSRVLTESVRCKKD